MENSVFLSFDESKLVSHIKIYENHLKQKIHLIPVCHIGTKEYFQNIVAYVGEEIPCIYENLKFGSIDDKSYKSSKTLDDLIEFYYENYYQSYDKHGQEYKSLLKNFYKKYTSKEVKKLHKLVRKEVFKSSNKIIQIFDLCEKTNFNLFNTYVLQVYWCEMLGLEHQMMTIDYENDILNRNNWCHGDLDFSKIKDKTNLEEKIKQILINPTQQLINESEKERTMVMGTLLVTINFYRMDNCTQRRRELATLLIENMTTIFQDFENSSPEIVLKTRNTIVEKGISILLEEFNEIMVFYGAMHMISIEKFLLNEGFKLISEESFEVFNVDNS